MEKKVLKRSEVNQQETWDLTRLFKTEADYNGAMAQIEELADKFAANYKGKLTTSEIINKALDDYREVDTLCSHVYCYANLHVESDQTNEENVLRAGNMENVLANFDKKVVFFTAEINTVDETILKEAADKSPANRRYITEVIKNLKHKLDPAVEIAMAELSQVLEAPYANYGKFKFADMTFDSFEVNGKTHEQSFTLFENGWACELDTDIRRAAFENFYTKLGQYENGLANNYQTQVLAEKAIANLRKFETVFDYLLHEQDVSVEFYDRQIDLIMEHLAKPMRKYANLIKETHKLDKLTYADLHLDIDPGFSPTVTVAKSRQFSIDSLAILGAEYKELIEEAFDERWIDFPQSIGRSTGGFCSSPYGKGSFILLNWSNQMREVLTLAHELGHAGHFYYAHKHQNAFDGDCSLYFAEAPSTMNEIILVDHLKNQSTDPRLQRYVLSTMVSKTYYHNCVTHLLEAHFQREVYRRVERQEPITAKVLNGLMLDTIKKFWGDTVEVPDYAGRTWMRQPHYFIGLYPYTYSAGLTIATAAFAKIKRGELPVERWLDMLKAGGTKSPVELALMADVDLSTEAPLMEMINYISGMIDEIATLS